jgi:hypothetical protein
MARAVPPWLHRVLLRDRGPADPWVKLVVFTVNSFMDDSGSCYPSQRAIAGAAAMGESTLRRKIQEACRAGWLSIEARTVYAGQHWKQYMYSACCPDTVDLEAIVLKDGQTAGQLADAHESKYGTIDPATLTGTMFPQTGKKRVVPPAPSGIPPAPGGSPMAQASPTHGSSLEAPPADVESTARSEQKHRPLTTFQPPAAAYEVLKSKFQEKSQVEGRSLARGDRRAVIAKVERSRAKTDEQVLHDMRKLLAATPDLGQADVARLLHVPLERIQALVASAALGQVKEA